MVSERMGREEQLTGSNILVSVLPVHVGAVASFSRVLTRKHFNSLREREREREREKERKRKREKTF